MFHPVGSQPPSVYWRRRFVALATLVVLVLLIVLTVRAATSGANGAPQAGGRVPATSGAGAPASSSTPALRHPTPSGSVHRPSSTPSRASGSSPHRRHATSGRQSAMSKSSHRQGSAAASSSPPPPRCTAADLQVRAYVPQSTYHVGDEPDVELQVTDVGSTPCVQDLSDRQIMLQVYNGESRVWGSHDCHVLAGTDDRVLSVGQTVRVSVTWSGYTSTPGCPAGSRQRVGAGTYTLYASLSGHQGAATQFSIV